MAKEQMHVVVGLIQRGDHVLIARRLQHVDQGGLWEFPGGKCETNETAEEALIRELHEELGIHVTQLKPGFQFEYVYADRVIFFDCWWVVDFTGYPTGFEGQVVKWVSKYELRQYQFPAANQQMIGYLLG